jgi:hypothetical protein
LFTSLEKAAEAAHAWRLKNLPGYDHNLLEIDKGKRRIVPSGPRKMLVVLCACGCGRAVRTPHRSVFAHGGSKGRPHGVLPDGCRIDKADAELLIGHTWHIGNHGYVCARFNKRINLLHRIIMHPPSDMVIDHINGDRLDNRRCNLRVISRSANTKLGALRMWRRLKASQ